MHPHLKTIMSRIQHLSRDACHPESMYDTATQHKERDISSDVIDYFFGNILSQAPKD